MKAPEQKPVAAVLPLIAPSCSISLTKENLYSHDHKQAYY
jgi:hypothetical protein